MTASQPPRHAAPSSWDLHAIVGELRQVRAHWRETQQRSTDADSRILPSRESVRQIMAWLSAALFPLRLGPDDLRRDTEDFFVGHTLDTALNALLQQVKLELAYSRRFQPDASGQIDIEARQIVQNFANSLPRLRALLDTDVQAAFRGDPAARSVDEVLVCYPGVLAIIHHRLAHEWYRLGVPLLARIGSELAHSQTGIDIHPGAQIGGNFFIDHGTGVVIGETAIIGENVRIYQAVTLGAKRFTSDADGNLHKGLPRHPIVEDDVVIYAGATILGRITIGKGSVIGGNVWLTRSVPANSTITQACLQDDVTG